MSPVLPETAPFSIEQRAWLNGFFAGVFGLDSQGELNGSSSGGTALLEAPTKVNEATEDESFPWHDPNLSLEDRMKLAEGKPIKRQMMAAMAQLNCGQCGYLCQTYSEALAAGQETNIGLCVPGGKETKKKLKELVTLSVSTPVKTKNESINSSNGVANHDSPTGYTKNNPYLAELVEVKCLNAAGSQKETNLVRIKIDTKEFPYEAGDSLGVWAENCEENVEQIMAKLGVPAETIVVYKGREASLKTLLMTELDIKKPSDSLLGLMIDVTTSPTEKGRLATLLENDAYDEYEVIDLLEEFSHCKLSAEKFVATLNQLQPRLYSISSSPIAHHGEVHLTIAAVRYQQGEKSRKGVASTFFADRVKPGSKIRIFLHHSPHFRLPGKPELPVIMVGPGTGIAPFRSFLHERAATKSTGKNWLFFGDQREQYDFLYKDELQQLIDAGILSRLDTAFSRDSDKKSYVQHKMQEQACELWNWLEQGAHFYVCGDAKRMAKDVHETLLQVIQEQGKRSKEEAQAYVQQMTQQGRYCRDVY